MKDIPYNLVGLGGTFDHLHEGHKTLLQNAFKLGKNVAIAITVTELLRTKDYKKEIESYEDRVQNVSNFIIKELGILPSRFSIIPLTDPFGPAISNAELEAHISSVETYKVAFDINTRRIQNGLPPLILIIIPLVLGDNGKRFSSSSIRASLDPSK
ncbi:MAG: pantetheine-phosphate adenylyltransferase [Promethearchaeota archaeon]